MDIFFGLVLVGSTATSSWNDSNVTGYMYMCAFKQGVVTSNASEFPQIGFIGNDVSQLKVKPIIMAQLFNEIHIKGRSRAVH